MVAAFILMAVFWRVYSFLTAMVTRRSDVLNGFVTSDYYDIRRKIGMTTRDAPLTTPSQNQSFPVKTLVRERRFLDFY